MVLIWTALPLGTGPPMDLGSRAEKWEPSSDPRGARMSPVLVFLAVATTPRYMPPIADAAGHQDAPVVVAAGLDVLLNPRIHAVVICQYIEIIHHNDSILHILLEQLTQITRPRIHTQDPQHTRVAGELHQRGPARQHQHDPLPVLQQPVGSEVQRRRPPRPPGCVSGSCSAPSAESRSECSP